MKRRINNIHLSCVTGLMSGFTKIIIEDRKASEIYLDNSPNTKKWVGLIKDLYNAPDEIRYKWMMTKVYHIDQTEDGMRFVICTQYEPY